VDIRAVNLVKKTVEKSDQPGHQICAKNIKSPLNGKPFLEQKILLIECALRPKKARISRPFRIGIVGFLSDFFDQTMLGLGIGGLPIPF
jgi:hypothetical protein